MLNNVMEYKLTRSGYLLLYYAETNVDFVMVYMIGRKSQFTVYVHK